MILAADLFCGAGGTSTGLIRAARGRSLRVQLTAINHWSIAVATHRLNHPWARHVCADLASVEADPSRLIPGGKLHILVASPECTHHSIARGGKPCSDQSRASAWHVLHWAERLRIDQILIENVREFQTWGPLLKNGRPDPRRKGETFLAFIAALRSLGYTVEWRVLNAADYGDATTRRRLFILAARSGRISWPAATHAGRWRPAREIIDWSLKGASIFNRKRPLARRTLDRIETGLRKFGGEAFIAQLAHAGGDNSRVRPITQPLPTIPAGHRGELALCEPFIVAYHAGKHWRGDRLHSLSEPLPTQTTENRFGLCQPFLTKYYRTGIAKPVTEPLDTVTTLARFALVEPAGMDIRFRMLQPAELAQAMGFDGYEFSGNKSDQVRQIGNAVAVGTAEALCGAMLDAV